MTSKVLSGNELIIQGGFEAGISLYTGYPGSPLADYFNILYKEQKRLDSVNAKAILANSEAHAAAMASGAKMAGKNVLVAMKSMGLHVASDALSVGNFANPTAHLESEPGVVVVVGDDPWSISTSSPADSRYLYKHLHIPFLMPTNAQELKDYIKVALEISKESGVYIGVLLTTFMAEGGGLVQTKVDIENLNMDQHLDPSKFDLSRNVMVPPNSLKSDIIMIEDKFPKVIKSIREKKLNTVEGNKNSKVGMICCGEPFETLKEVLIHKSLYEIISLHKVITPYPLDELALLEYLKSIEVLFIFEEKRNFLEQEILTVIQKYKLNIEVYGKSIKLTGGKYSDLVPSHGGLNYENIESCINLILENFKDYFKQLNKKNIFQVISKYVADINLPRRLPTFCPGCPHRETLSLLKEIRKEFDKQGIKLISHGDVGCYSLAFLSPFYEMHDLSGMGQGGALGAGSDIFINNPSVVLMGDSTFFHSGMTAISNSVQLGHNITYILLDNDNTAMTGHQMTPRTGLSVDGVNKPRQEIKTIVQGMGVAQLKDVNPSDRYFYKNLLVDYVKQSGVKVIISNKECGLTFHSRKRKEDRKLLSQDKTLKKKTFYQINSLSCEGCLECVEMTGCPGLSFKEDAYGKKITIDPQICVSDSYCTKIKVCPSFEEVDTFEYHPNKFQNEKNSQSYELPLPKKKITFQDIIDGKNFRIIVTGVGGSGVTTISKIMAKAIEKSSFIDKIDFKFIEQKGLAQRNGAVTGHLVLFKKGMPASSITAEGSADLVVSPDLLEGLRSVKFLNKEKGSLVLDSKYQTPMSLLLSEENDSLNIQENTKKVKNILKEKIHFISAKDKAFEAFKNPVYAPSIILGKIYQMGLLPFEKEDIQSSFQDVVPKNVLKNNLEAFEIGRKLFDKKEEETESVELISDDLFTQSLKEGFFYNKKPLERFHKYKDYYKNLKSSLEPEYWKTFIHDIIIFDGGINLEKFTKEVLIIDSEVNLLGGVKDHDYKQLISFLAKTYFIKDEVFIAHALTSIISRKKDEEFYKNIAKSFKKKHINRPEFTFFGIHFSFDIKTRRWMLNIMKHSRFLRKVLIGWHKKEKIISEKIKFEIINNIIKINDKTDQSKRIKEIASIKGFRNVRYQKALKVFPGLFNE
jgi:indolepyruvate ferredoxin oxidoreductase